LNCPLSSCCSLTLSPFLKGVVWVPSVGKVTVAMLERYTAHDPRLRAAPFTARHGIHLQRTRLVAHNHTRPSQELGAPPQLLQQGLHFGAMSIEALVFYCLR
jgi:hypothetical protein